MLGWIRAPKGLCRYDKANMGGILDCLVDPALPQGQGGDGKVMATEKMRSSGLYVLWKLRKQGLRSYQPAWDSDFHTVRAA